MTHLLKSLWTIQPHIGTVKWCIYPTCIIRLFISTSISPLWSTVDPKYLNHWWSPTITLTYLLSPSAYLIFVLQSWYISYTNVVVYISGAFFSLTHLHISSLWTQRLKDSVGLVCKALFVFVNLLWCKSTDVLTFQNSFNGGLWATWRHYRRDVASEHRQTISSGQACRPAWQERCPLQCNGGQL